MQENYNASLRIFVVLAYLTMIIINGVGNLLPLNGMSTGMVSDSYPNLFAPAGLTFAIWGVIYFLLACYILYQWGFFHKIVQEPDPKLMRNIAIYFIISSLANAAWIFAWHFQQIPMSMLLMVVILICLIMVNKEINKNKLSSKEKFFLRVPFSVYFAWITVATIANATVLLVSLGWAGFGISEIVWASIVIALGMLIGVRRIFKDRNIAYGLVLIWAYLGILIKHTGSSGFNGQYPQVIAVVAACIIIFIAAEIYIMISKRSTSLF